MFPRLFNSGFTSLNTPYASLICQALVNAPMQNRDTVAHEFNELLTKAVEEAMSEVLGAKAASSIFYYLETYHSLKREELPDNLSIFFSVLEKMFGTGGRTIGRAVVRKLYVKLALEFVEKPDKELTDYIAEAMKQLAKRT